MRIPVLMTLCRSRTISVYVRSVWNCVPKLSSVLLNTTRSPFLTAGEEGGREGGGRKIESE